MFRFVKKAEKIIPRQDILNCIEIKIYVSAFYGPMIKRAVDKAYIFVGSRVCVQKFKKSCIMRNFFDIYSREVWRFQNSVTFMKQR